jgi:cysteinyl-tRNA synthetase
MTIRLFNTLTKTKEDFTPIRRDDVYVCGPTVYDFAHIGNARPAIVFDVLYRLLRHTYGADHVTYVRNITDVDDKINARALRDFPNLPLNDAIRNVTEKTEAQYHADVAALGCLPPTHEPRATDHIGGMIAMIQTLLDKDHAYVAQGDEGREALFDIRKMEDYGQLSRRKLEDQLAGARVEAKDYKRNPGDFVLWKESNSDEPGWDATFRISDANRDDLRVNSNAVSVRGRPGWHIECSVMSAAFLGNVFDIHGGGLDLIFPHHENEIAQSRCAHGTPVMANVWMHNGFLQVEGEKMSKSLGNFFTIQDHFLGVVGGRVWEGPVLRFAMLQTHYRQPIDWTVDGLRNAERVLAKWKGALDLHHASLNSIGPLPDRFIASLQEDLNLPQAIAEMHRMADEARKGSVDAASELASAGVLLGLDWMSVQSVKDESDIRRGAAAIGDEDGSIAKAIDARLAARKAKNFAESDRIRDELLAQGIVLKDGPTGTTWEIKR